MFRQITSTLMMVRPAAFHRNEETAVNNHYQHSEVGKDLSEIHHQAVGEFDAMVANLRSHDIQVLVYQDTIAADTPDSIFPNNWNSFHENGKIYLYPMYAENRRREVKPEILEDLGMKFQVSEIHSFESWAEKNIFLEGTGSMVLDRENEIVYAALADRTHLALLEVFCERENFKQVTFTAYQSVGNQRLPIYHTNVMMCLGERFCVICLESIDDPMERNKIVYSLNETGKEIIEISEQQCNSFAGNMLQVCNLSGERFVVMSQSAFDSLTEKQHERLAKHGKLLPNSLPTIEKYGGGSARCMMAEIFLQPNERL